MRSIRSLFPVLLAVTLALSACGGATDTDSTLELTSVGDVADIVESPPDDLVILDIRTPEEFAAGHLAGAINIDYYAADFEARLGELDTNVPYVMYCNSGNRSGNTLPLMDAIGFEEVYELDGGIQAWLSAGEPVEQ
ncbi:MAG: rhodanese-like domain-containing protein [Acidimicrobiia bacterium]|nr:rhodanese-like domain-containing protein [Acidimicrobiia bacterium]